MLRSLLMLWLVGTAWAAGSGWRGDGTSVARDARLPASWTPTWKVGLSSWGNASPVVAGSVVCVTLEPTTLACFDAATGAERWRFPHEVVDTLPAGEREAVAARLDAAGGLERERTAALQERSRLLRAARGGDAAAKARVDALSARLDQLKRSLDEIAWARTAVDCDIIGYATPTPVTDGRALWALFGNGVVARHDLDGRLRWSRWLGPPPGQMRGYSVGVAASPLLVDGVLLAPYGALYGLDPATGATRWKVDGYTDYGTPAIARVGGRAYAALPDGRVVRVADGALVAEKLADPWYVGPHAEGDVVVWIGGHAIHDNMAAGHVPAIAVRLVPDGDRVEAAPLWTAKLPVSDLFYTAPVVHGGRLVSVSRSGELRVIDLATGAVQHTRDLLGELGGFVYASPTVVGDRVIVISERGVVLELATSGAFAVLARHELGGQHRATPTFVGDRVYLRPLDGLACLGCPP